MTKLTEEVAEKKETLVIREKIAHILSTIKRGKNGEE